MPGTQRTELEQVQLLLQSWKSDITYQDICRRVGLPPNKLYKLVHHLRSLGYNLPDRRMFRSGHPTTLSPERRAFVKAALEAGDTQSEIAHKLGITRQAVSAFIKRAGLEGSVPRRVRARREARRLRELRFKLRLFREQATVRRRSRYYLQGLTASEIARREGISHQAISNFITRWREKYPDKFPYRHITV